MNKQLKNVMFAVCLCAAGGLFAAAPTLTTYNWAKDANGLSISGSFGDESSWEDDVVPDALSLARFWYCGPESKKGGYTVTLPTMQTKATLRIHARDDIPITFNGAGNVFQALSTETDNYGEHFISIYGGARPPNAGSEQAYFVNSSFRGGYKLTDAVFTVKPYWVANASLDYVRFQQGTFNFYDPEGVPLSSTFYISGGNDNQEAKYIFEPASSLRIYGITFGQYGQTSRQTVRFNGNTHYVFGDLWFNRDNGARRVSSVHVDGGATLYAGRVRMSNSQPSSAAGYNGTHQLFVENGATLVSSNGINCAAYGTQLVAITNGASVTFGTAETKPYNQIWGADGYNWQCYSTNTVLVKDSTLTMIGTNEFSNTHLILDNATATFGHSFAFGKKWDGRTYLAATNSTMNFGGVQANFGCNYGQRVTVDLYNTKINGTGLLYLGQFSYKQGDYRMSASCDMTMDGPESAITLNSAQSGSCLHIGSNGSAVLRMKDGSISTYQLLMASSPNCVTSVLHQTGGTITVTGGKYSTNENGWYGFNVFDADAAATPAYCHVILDGGEIRAHRFHARYSRTFSKHAGWARLDANGGAIVGLEAKSAENNITVKGFDEANLGEKGLTIRSDYETRTAQDFRDLEGYEGKGLLRLEGAGTKKLSGTNSTESVLLCAGGKALLLPNATTGANASHYSNVTVTNGAVLSLAGDQTAVTFRSLTLANGSHLELEKTDRITVDGSVVVGEGLSLDITDAAAAGTYPLIVCAGEVSETTTLNWRRAIVTIAERTGFGVTPRATYDAQTDKTTFALEITVGGPLTGEVTWDGTWKSTGADLVKFTGGGTAAVAVDANVTVGALAFDSALDYTLAGVGTLIFSDRGGYARVDVARGEETISSKVDAPADLALAPASGAKLTVDGEIVVGGIVKEGRGTVSLENPANDLSAGVTVKEGLLTVPTPEALGKGPLSLQGGTLEITGEGTVKAPAVTLATASAAAAAIVKSEADVTMAAPAATQGAFIKRGAGRLTLESDGNVTVCGSKAGPLAGANNERVRSTTTFDDEGGYTVGGDFAFGGLNVAEGELVLRGTSPGVTFTAPSYVCVGIGTSQGTVSPGLVVDNANLTCNGNRFTFANTYTSTFAKAPYLIVTNKSTLVGSFTCGWNVQTSGFLAKMLVDDSVQFSGYMFYPMRSDKRAEYVYRNGSALYVNMGGNATEMPTKSYYGLTFDNGSATLTFTNSILARKATLTSDVTLPVTIANESNWTTHGVYLRDGSTLYSNWVTNKYSTVSTLLTVGFDNSEWKPIRSDQTGDFIFDFPPYATVRFEMEGRGVILAPVAGKTFTVVSPLLGAGGLRKQGAGTLAFACKDGMKSWDFEGTMSLEEGTVTLAAGAVRDGAKADLADGTTLNLNGATLTGAALSGKGAVTGGTLASSTLKADVSDAGEVLSCVTLAGVTYTGRTIVDFGRTEENPLSTKTPTMTLFSYTGTAPDVSGWKARGLGAKGIRGRFVAANGVVTCTVETAGLLLTIH